MQTHTHTHTHTLSLLTHTHTHTLSLLSHTLLLLSHTRTQTLVTHTHTHAHTLKCVSLRVGITDQTLLGSVSVRSQFCSAFIVIMVCGTFHNFPDAPCLH